MRVDPVDLVARHGAGWSLIDAQERCRMVACDGAVFYLASRTYGAPWRVLLGDEALKETLSEGPAPITAEALVRPAVAQEAPVPLQQGIVTRRAETRHGARGASLESVPAQPVPERP